MSSAEQNRLYMENKKIIRFVESFVLLPMMTMTIPVGNVPNMNVVDNLPQIVLSQKSNIEAPGLLAFNQAIDQKAKILEAKAEAIDAYYAERSMPLEGMGMKMVIEAEKNGIDWRLVAAISVIESTGGRHSCQKVTNSFLGWGSCKINFESPEKAIEIVSWNLGGGNPNTDQHYEGKTTKEILLKYNPPEIVIDYSQKVMKVMEKIGPEVITLQANS